MNPKEKDILIEAAVSAYRERDALGGIRPSTEWWDLNPGERNEVFERALESRVLEGATSPDGLSTTARAVLSRIGFLSQLT